MDWDRKSIRIGGVVLICSIALRLFAVGLTGDLPRKALSVLWFLETGRIPGASLTLSTEPKQTEKTAPELPPETTPEEEEMLAVFSAEDACLVEINNVCGYETDVEKGLTQTLSWDLKAASPTVLIVHSHGSESYENTENYTPSGDYRTQDVSYNVVSIGDRLAELLEAGGIHTIHDRTLHDVPSYSNAYGSSRESIARYLEQYPGICLVLDIHRDASDGSDGSQLSTSATVGGQLSSQLLVMVGTDAQGNYHPNWQENLSLALKLSAQLERADPGVTRPVTLRGERFNTDLTAGSLLIEVGAAGDTHDQALLAANALARGILALAKGAQ